MFKIRDSVISDVIDVANVHVMAWQESYFDIIDDEYLKSYSLTQEKLLVRQKILSNQSEHEIHLVALFDNRIIGFCDAGIDSSIDANDGQLYAIYILNEYKGSGIGRDFFQKVLNYFRQIDVNKFVAWVLEDNINACLFYSKLGGKIVNKKNIFINNKSYSEICYEFICR